MHFPTGSLLAALLLAATAAPATAQDLIGVTFPGQMRRINSVADQCDEPVRRGPGRPAAGHRVNEAAA